MFDCHFHCGMFAVLTLASINTDGGTIRPTFIASELVKPGQVMATYLPRQTHCNITVCKSMI